MTHGVEIKDGEQRDKPADIKEHTSTNSLTESNMSSDTKSDNYEIDNQRTHKMNISYSKLDKAQDETKDNLVSIDEKVIATKSQEHEVVMVPTEAVPTLLDKDKDTTDKEAISFNDPICTLDKFKKPASIGKETKSDLPCSVLVSNSSTCTDDACINGGSFGKKAVEPDVKQFTQLHKTRQKGVGGKTFHAELVNMKTNVNSSIDQVHIRHFSNSFGHQEEKGERSKDLAHSTKCTKKDEGEFLNVVSLQPLITLKHIDEKVEAKLTNTNNTSTEEKLGLVVSDKDKKQKNPMVVAVPTKEQLANAFGGGFGNFRGDRDGEDISKIGRMYIQKCKVLGQGPNSVVFEGRLESQNGIPIAVKRITCKDKSMAVRTQKEMDELWNKLYREVELLRGVEHWRHPNIVGYYCSKTVLNELYIAFQLCQGDLEDYVSEEYRFWREHINPRQINQHMAEGVRFLHANAIVHRDLKPKNVFLVWKQGHCTAVIGDLGMSKATVKGIYSLSLSVGSIGYLAPEVWEEASKVVRFNNNERPKIEDKSDIFPLGLLFFFTITNGKNPFGDELLGNQLRIAAGRPPSFNHNRPEDYALEVLLGKMFSRNPKVRPTAEEVCAHPGLWENDEIMKFFSDSSDLIESMYKEGRPVDHIVANGILPHGNWMRDLPEALRHYLKRYRVHGKLLYQGKESSTRYLLRAIRNIAAHFKELPDELKDEFKVHQAEFWMSKCPLLLPNLYRNIELSKVSAPSVKRYVVAVPSKRPNVEEDSSTETVRKKDTVKTTTDHSTKRPFIRRRKSKPSSGTSASTMEVIQLPVHWKPMTTDEPIRMVQLLDTNTEYQQIAGQFLHEATSGPYSHKMEFDLTKLRVTKIEKVQNRRLYQQFSVRRIQIEEEKGTDGENGPLFRRLWHGTTTDSVASIIHNGFNRGYSGKNGTWYGEGVYFAVSASYAARSWITQCIPGKKEEGHIFLADVVVGCYCRGHYGMRYLPPIDPEEPTVMYDSAADNPDNPMEFVIFHDSQAYPSYLVTFTSS